jgi:hypothetical protein
MVLPRAASAVDGMNWPWRRSKRNGDAHHAPGQDRSRVLIATSLGGYDHAQALDATLGLRETCWGKLSELEVRIAMVTDELVKALLEMRQPRRRGMR